MKVEYTWSEYFASLTPECEAYASHSDSWCGGESFASAKNKMANGDDTYVAMAEALLEELETVTEGVPRREWTPSPFGAFPVVPEFLAGLPVCMRAMAPSGDLSPVKIVVSTTCSGGIGAETMTRRGVAILALCMKLQAIRPIELYLLVEGNDEKNGKKSLFQMIRIDTKPLSIAHACFALANVGFARALTYSHMHHYHSWHGDWPKDYASKYAGRHGLSTDQAQARYDRIVREQCEMSPEDLWISSSYLHDTLLMSDPVKWVNDQIRRYASSEAPE